ncbi:MAG TPA: hypothetical protein VGH28_14985 [Polyangiaceae bacterium]|jgi:hypothetical protein
MSKKNTQSTRRDLARVRVAAATKYFAKRSVLIDGVDLSGDDLAAVFQRVLDSEDAIDSLRALLREALDARDVAGDKAAHIAKALEGIVGAAYGTTSSAFSEFGFAPRKVATKSAETKALAVEKVRATRAARHTLGPRQKARIFGAPVDPDANENVGFRSTPT